MVNVHITQETFDAAVQENIELLEMEESEAISEAIRQFESQGVNLSGIQKNPKDQNQESEVNKLCNDLKNFDLANISSSGLKHILTQLSEKCESNDSNKRAAVIQKAHELALRVLLKVPLSDIETHLAGIKFLLILMTKHPDLLTSDGEMYTLSLLDKDVHLDVIRENLKLIKQCCILHENNRQHFVEKHILEKLKVLLSSEDHVSILKGILSVYRTLILDDDIRVEFGHAHEHARLIATENLSVLVEYTSKFKTDQSTVADLILTLSSLLVRNEFCKQVVDEGLLEVLKEVMSSFKENETLCKYSFGLLKALAGNDECKRQIIVEDFAPTMALVLTEHKNKVRIASAGLRTVAALALRSPESSKALCDANIPDILVQCMKLHPGDKNLQKNASWAIRNMVSRCRYQNPIFLELGVEDILKKDMDSFKEFSYDFKAALRDLNCQVEFKEEWTGKGGKINSDSSIKNDNN